MAQTKIQQQVKTRNNNGEGSVYQLKDGRWGTAVYLDRNVIGKKDRKVFTAKTQEEACEKMRNFLIENGYIEEEESPQYHSELSTEMFIVDTLDSLKSQVSDRTLQGYAYDISHFRKQFGSKKIRAITVKELMNFLDAMANKKNDKGEYVYSQSTMRAERRMIKLLFSRAKSKGIIADNPCLDYDFKPVKSKKYTKEIETFTEDEIMKLLEALKENTSLYVPFILQLNSGMRTEELLALQWGDIDKINKKIHVERALTLSYAFNEEYTVSKSSSAHEKAKTINSIREISILDEEVFQQLERWKVYAKVNTKTKFGTNDFVFGNRDNPYWSYSGYNKAVRVFLKENAPKGFRLHRIRHTTATVALANDASLKAVQNLLGHANIATTAKYVTPTEEILEGGAKGIQNGLNKIRTKKQGSEKEKEVSSKSSSNMTIENC